MSDPRFTAKPPRNSTWRYLWVLALIVAGLLAYLRPWAAETPLVFRLRPAEPAASGAAPTPNAVGVRLIPSAPGTAASRPKRAASSGS